MNSEEINEIKKYLSKAYRGTLEKILLSILKSWSVEKAKAAIRWGHYAKEEEVLREKIEADKSPRNSPLRLIKSRTGETSEEESVSDLKQKKDESRREFINAGPCYPYPYRPSDPDLATTMVKSEINNLNLKIEKLTKNSIRIMLCDVLYANWQIEDAELLVRRAELAEKLDKQDQYSESYKEKLASEYNTIVSRLTKKELII